MLSKAAQKEKEPVAKLKQIIKRFCGFAKDYPKLL